MSTAKRLISGSAASWARILVTMLTQIALVPIFLTYWNVKTYGIWIAIQALVNVLSTFDRGHNDFLEYEFLKLGPDERKKISFKLWSGIKTTAVIGLLELIVVYVVSIHLNIDFLLGEGNTGSEIARNEIGWAIVAQWLGWTLTNLIGLFFRALSAYGYFPRIGWWNVLLAIVSSVIPVIFVTNGANLLIASISATSGIFLILLLQYLDVRKLLIKEQLFDAESSIKIGFSNYLTSLGLSGRYFLDNFRQQGVRLLLAPIVGAAGLAAFSTTRTIANVTQQGLLTITHPLLPELMRFLRQKDQQKMETSFGTVWFVLVAVLSPAVLILQSITPSLFTIWTKGQIDFNPILFATLSFGVLIFALAQPAMAVVVGNNLLKVQIMISFASSLIVIAGIFLFVPKINILGAGISLLLAEIISAIGFLRYAKHWLETNGLAWPSKASKIASFSLYITATSVCFIIYFPEFKWPSLLLGIFFQIWNAVSYWKNLPYEFHSRVNLLLDKFVITRGIKVLKQRFLSFQIDIHKK